MLQGYYNGLLDPFSVKEEITLVLTFKLYLFYKIYYQVLLAIQGICCGLQLHGTCVPEGPGAVQVSRSWIAAK